MRPDPERLLDYREFPVLCVDDEVENLRVLELGLRREFTIVTADNADMALRLFNEHPIAVVLSDHRMPGMTGVDLLARMRELDSKAIRILVTAYGDAETLGRAVNDSSIYRYVAKPWNLDEMRLTLRRAIEVYALEDEREALLTELTVLNRVSHTINQQLRLDPLLDLILGALTEELGYDGATLLLIDEDRVWLRPARSGPAQSELGEVLERVTFEVRRAPRFVERLRQGEAQTLTLGDALALEGPVRDWAMEVSADEILVVPLLGKQRVIGALALDNRSGGRPFRAEDRTLLEGLATRVVTAIANASLVDDLRRSQKRATAADELGTIRALTASLAREIQESLESVRSFLVSAPGKRSDDDGAFWAEQQQQSLRDEEQARHLASTIERLGGADAARARVACDLAELVRRAAAAVVDEARRDAGGIAIECDPRTPKVVAEQQRLYQVIAHLLRNAIEASPADAAVTLRLAPDSDGADSAPRGVVLEVTDRGRGIPPEDLDRIFDPLFTTKRKGAEHGLGLAVCQQFVVDHGGSIEVRSDEGEGATFRVRLPGGAEDGS